MSEQIKSCTIYVTGLVQGVGFRPFVHKIACKQGLTGFVRNTTGNVEIHLEGPPEAIEAFLIELKSNPPHLAQIETLERVDHDQLCFYEGFVIVSSDDNASLVTRISPDIAVCPECLQDMREMPGRLDYPFTNCINCGPRFSIIKDLPYDRIKTTMAPFTMCPSCSDEYKDIENRRYHAQPNACRQCGPGYTLFSEGPEITGIQQILDRVSRAVCDDRIVAFKGIGGFHLGCNAFSDKAVRALREGKLRQSKPFALMFSSIEALEEYAVVSEREKEALLHHARPIVLVKKRAGKEPASEISRGLDTIGVMLPYMPFHHLLFERLSTCALVLTSGNISSEPIIIDNEKALQKLKGIADITVTYNREIYNRTDDSVVFAVQDELFFIRRSRGFVPDPVGLPFSAHEILALGGELKNTFALGKQKRAYISQHIGDLTNYDTFCFYREQVDRFLKLFRSKPALCVCDKHQGYYSSGYARELGIPLLEVQHHHAHIASVIAEHSLEGEVIGICFDGTGAGDDNTIWGSEFFVCDLRQYRRLYHFEPVMLPGGDRAVTEGYPVALSYLYQLYGQDIFSSKLDFLQNIPGNPLELLLSMLEKKINSPLSSGAGRLFDAVAALTGLCIRPGFEAEGPMRLESVLDTGSAPSKGAYRYSIDRAGGIIRVLPVLEGVISDLSAGAALPVIAARFHNSIINVIVETAMLIRDNTGLRAVCLSGGVFQNRYILEHSRNRLQKEGFIVYCNHQVPSNDGGISLGQLAIAACKQTEGSLQNE